MLDPQVLLHLRQALEGEPNWLEVPTRLQRLAPEGREEAHRRVRAGGPFGAANRADDWRFPPAVADVEEADICRCG